MGMSGSAATGSSFGKSVSQALSQSDGFSQNAGSSFGQSGSSTFVDANQQPHLNSLYQRASATADPGGAQRAVGGAAEFGRDALEGGIRTTQGLMDPTGQIAAQSDSLKAELGSLFSDEINPALKSEAIAAGGFGGGRQGVAQGVAAGKLGDAFTKGYGDIVARANDQAGRAAAGIGGIVSDYRNNAEARFGAGLDQLGSLSAILGGPTILSESFNRTGSRSSGTSRNTSISKAGTKTKQGSNTESQKFMFSLF